MDSGLSLDELRSLPTVVDLLTAARAFGLGPTRAYELAARGAFPCRVLRIGGTYRVPTADLLTVLGLPTSAPAPTELATHAAPPTVDHRPGATRDSPDPRPHAPATGPAESEESR